MDLIEKGAALIREGKLVVFPTETVYGLGADATNDKAVASIFEAKGRPQFNPLIAHFASKEMLHDFVEVTPMAQKLIDTFWPGSLTLVLKRKENCKVSYLASAGLDTLAVRMPKHSIALSLIEKAGVPIVAPSANPSGTISTTTAPEVEAVLGDKVDLVLDGGPCSVGVESTVLLLTNEPAVLLRPGGLALEKIEQVIGPVIRPDKDPECPRSPGQLSSHYAPFRQVRINATDKKEGEAYLGFGPCDFQADLNLSATSDLTEAAANLFHMMHLLDREPFTSIAIAPIPFEGLGLAINDRIKRAAYPKRTIK
ncbi:MAG: threonylcarbamoyl-AMP synthase [Alphaproteobacteria bacterium]|nr:threonylcarbamoyl-AMP synthase [Alphaproteobacteria bacterium]